jgi:hypothetical protein
MLDLGTRVGSVTTAGPKAGGQELWVLAAVRQDGSKLNDDLIKDPSSMMLNKLRLIQ